MFCEQCGNKLPENAMFCPKCGTSCSDDTNVPETDGGIKSGKKPKKHRKKSKAIIALCSAVAVVGVSVGGFALYQNYGKPSVIQKANDLDVAFGVFYNFSDEITDKYAKKYPDKDEEEQCSECKISYNTAKKYIEKIEKSIEEQEKYLEEETDEEIKKSIEYNILSIPGRRAVYTDVDNYDWYNKVSNMKNVYNLYAPYIYDGMDFYTAFTCENKKLPKEFKNLTNKDYSWAYLSSYRVEDGKIYSKLTDGFKIEGELLDQDILIEERLKETQEDVKKNKKERDKNLKEKYGEQASIDEALKEYEKYLNKWKNISKTEEEVCHDVILYRIKDYKDGVLYVKDCYRPVPSFGYFMNNYEPTLS